MNEQQQILVDRISYLRNREFELRQRTHKTCALANRLQTDLLNIQRNQILNETPQQKQIRCLMRTTGLSKNVIEKGIKILKAGHNT